MQIAIILIRINTYSPWLASVRAFVIHPERKIGNDRMVQPKKTPAVRGLGGRNLLGKSVQAKKSAPSFKLGVDPLQQVIDFLVSSLIGQRPFGPWRRLDRARQCLARSLEFVLFKQEFAVEVV
jgi:hypothetical protein